MLIENLLGIAGLSLNTVGALIMAGLRLSFVREPGLSVQAHLSRLGIGKRFKLKNIEQAMFDLQDGKTIAPDDTGFEDIVQLVFSEQGQPSHLTRKDQRLTEIKLSEDESSVVFSVKANPPQSTFPSDDQFDRRSLFNYFDQTAEEWFSSRGAGLLSFGFFLLLLAEIISIV